jgi:hypothetical protein
MAESQSQQFGSTGFDAMRKPQNDQAYPRGGKPDDRNFVVGQIEMKFADLRQNTA